MPLNVISNFAANVAHRNLSMNDTAATNSLAKLSAGTRVLSAKDDAAALAVGNRLAAEVAGLKQAQVNAGQGVSMLQIADGAGGFVGVIDNQDNFGSAVAPLDDLDGNGVPDLAVGAPQDPEIGAGYVSVFSGKTGELLATHWGEAVGDRFGAAIAGAGDHDGDGVPDLLIGAPGRRDRGGWMLLPGPARKR